MAQKKNNFEKKNLGQKKPEPKKIEQKKSEPTSYDEPQAFPVKLQVILAAVLFFTLLLWLFSPNDFTKIIFAVAIAASAILSLINLSADFNVFRREKLSIVSLLALIILGCVLFLTSEPLVITLFTFYALLALKFSGKVIKLQTAAIIAIAITAIIFRVYPALPGTGPAPGHLISMDDPYFHYKYTQDIYEQGDLPSVDYRMYPPVGLAIPKLFPFYYNAYLALLSGTPLQPIAILYPVIMSAFGAIMLFFLMKELTGDWKSGALGGFFFATMPMILTKSQAGAVEEDLMGMVLGIFSMYLLVKAIRSKGTDSLKFAVLSGLAFFITSITWGGILFLYAAPFLAIAGYSLITTAVLLFVKLKGGKNEAFANYDTWHITRIALIAGILPLILRPALIGIPIDITQAVPYGFVLFFGIWAEFLRLKLLSGKDFKFGIETRVFTLLVILSVLAIAGVILFYGADNILNIPGKALERLSGISSQNYLVDKTISEQAALASGDVWTKLCVGLMRYGIAEVMSVLMAFVLVAILLYYFIKNNVEQFFSLLLAYSFSLMFFIVTMVTVWSESRLGFSQSLGFILLAATIGLLLPKSKAEFQSLKIISLLLVVGLVIIATFVWGLSCSGFNAQLSSVSDLYRPAADGLFPYWFNGVKWIENNPDFVKGHFNPDGSYTNGDYVLTWWDYGHFITAMSSATVIADPTQNNEEYIMRTARFFHNTTSEDEAMAWLMTQPWNQKRADGTYPTKFIILDYSLIGKSSALTFLGTNYYEYPNGYEAVNGVCQQGQICQNVELGFSAEVVDGEYKCKQGVVCPRDDLVSQIEDKKCCEAQPIKCCDESLRWQDVVEKGGSARIVRPASVVYDEYEIERTGIKLCEKYFTSETKYPIVENGESVWIDKSYLYLLPKYSDGRNVQISTGQKYSDGNYYPAISIMILPDGSASANLISSDCKAININNLLREDYVYVGEDLIANIFSKDKGLPFAFYHAPAGTSRRTFTELYMLDSKNLKNMTMVYDTETAKFYPYIKVYEIKYPSTIPVVKTNVARDSDVVYVEYTGKFENGTVFDTSIGRAPLKFTLGEGQMIPGFENAVRGMALNETKTVTLPPEQAYGVGTGHSLANKTLVFDIKLVGLNGLGETTKPKTEGQLNMTFDYYDKALAASYNVDKFPTLVWNCERNRIGTVSTGATELEALGKLTCVFNKGQPKDVCAVFGVAYNNETGKIMADQLTQSLLSKNVGKTGLSSCSPNENRSVIQAFYSKDCATCASQKEALDQLSQVFADYLNVTYYCAGDEQYCLASSRQVL